MIFKKKTNSHSILQKRIRKFKTMKRGYYSFIILTTLYLLSFLNPIFINNKALIVSYNDELYFPLLSYHSADTFNQKGYGEANYRELNDTCGNEDGNWVLMPFSIQMNHL